MLLFKFNSTYPCLVWAGLPKCHLPVLPCPQQLPFPRVCHSVGMAIPSIPVVSQGTEVGSLCLSPKAVSNCHRMRTGLGTEVIPISVLLALFKSVPELSGTEGLHGAVPAHPRTRVSAFIHGQKAQG